MKGHKCGRLALQFSKLKLTAYKESAFKDEIVYPKFTVFSRVHGNGLIN